MAKKLFVGGVDRNAPADTVKQMLTDEFAKFGEVSDVAVITDRMTGGLRGFAFVEMPNDAEATAAIEGINGTVIEGITFRNITVNEAQPREERPRRDFNRGGYDNNR